MITDEKCETGVLRFYALGDLRKKYANQIIRATADGCAVTLAAAHYVETRKGDE
jgi:thioredoxin reductase